jgi:hypothetical protein
MHPLAEQVDYRDPEIVDPRLESVEKLAYLMDRSIRIGEYSIGLDGIIGLVPGIGDFVGALISMYVVATAVRLGYPRVTVARMLVNIAIDAAVGTVPVAGDLFDFAFKATTRNVALMRAHLVQPRRQRNRDVLFMIAAIGAVFAIVSLPVLMIVWLVYRFGWF